MPELLKELERLVGDSQKETYLLRLRITGTTPQSGRAIRSLKAMCERFLQGRYELEVVEVEQQPWLAHGQQLLVVPTLIKRRPLPGRRLVGDRSNRLPVLLALDLTPRSPNEEPGRPLSLERPVEVAGEVESLRARLAEAEQTLAAIRSGEGDALGINGPLGKSHYAR